jgi:hypothetical protein
MESTAGSIARIISTCKLPVENATMTAPNCGS